MNKPKIFNDVTPKELFLATLDGYTHSESEFLRGIKLGFDAAIDKNINEDSFKLGAVCALEPDGISSLFVKGIYHGIALTKPDGWQHVAPAWLRESRKAANV